MVDHAPVVDHISKYIWEHKVDFRSFKKMSIKGLEGREGYKGPESVRSLWRGYNQIIIYEIHKE